MSCNRWNGYNNDQIQIFSRSRFAITSKKVSLTTLTLDLLFRVLSKVRCWFGFFGFGSSVLTSKLGVFTGNTFEWSWAAWVAVGSWDRKGWIWMDHICGSVCFLLRDFHTWVNLIYPKHQGYYDWTWLWWSTWYMWFNMSFASKTVEGARWCNLSTLVPTANQHTWWWWTISISWTICLSELVRGTFASTQCMSVFGWGTSQDSNQVLARDKSVVLPPQPAERADRATWQSTSSQKWPMMMGGFKRPIFIKSLIETEK